MEVSASLADTTLFASCLASHRPAARLKVASSAKSLRCGSGSSDTSGFAAAGVPLCISSRARRRPRSSAASVRSLFSSRTVDRGSRGVSPSLVLSSALGTSVAVPFFSSAAFEARSASRCGRSFSHFAKSILPSSVWGTWGTTTSSAIKSPIVYWIADARFHRAKYTRTSRSRSATEVPQRRAFPARYSGAVREKFR